MRWFKITYQILLTAALLSTAARPAMSMSAQAPDGLDPLTRHFAYCTGRLSAQLEFSWLFAEIDSDQIAAQRRAMITLLEATQPEDAGVLTLHLRVSAKFAHADLLRRAAFETEPARARAARARADNEISHCLSMILS